MSNDSLASTTTRSLVGTLEAVVFVSQGISILVTSYVDKLLPDGRLLLIGMAVAHFALGAVVYRTGGPFRLGGPWTLLWLGLVVLMPLVMAHLVAPTEYAESPACVQLCTYPTSAAVLVAFYPWLGVGLLGLRRLAGPAFLAVVIVEPLLIVLALKDQPHQVNFESVAASAVTVLLAFGFGKAIGAICRTATGILLDEKDASARRLVAQRDAQTMDFFDFLHAQLLTSISAIQSRPDGAAVAAGELSKLRDEIRQRRKAILLDQEFVPLATLFEEHLRRFHHKVVEAPRLGIRDVPRAAAKLLDQALGDLLANAAKHGQEVRIRFGVTGWDVAELDVIDDGPGFPNEYLYMAGKNLDRLRCLAEAAGGSLERFDAKPSGSRLRLTVPLAVNLAGGAPQ